MADTTAQKRRNERLAKQLRANLLQRKSQARERNKNKETQEDVSKNTKSL
ncbi:hypothetical protein [Bartonella tamiae]|uniref:Uncharacterized protein n=1 Tax=Bartonella tamiae Th239 TaxID=1094558 RepID=J0R7C7_9HYPH|nr:hypothetical protein [Bartonella tamiae]EJF91639.1 hypothetical protein ME5_00018 [Bartonella tamiae Th239]EJF92686.1 hypothetical protein MEG_01856 [Bartonella tamiae Th307]